MGPSITVRLQDLQLLQVAPEDLRQVEGLAGGQRHLLVVELHLKMPFLQFLSGENRHLGSFRRRVTVKVMRIMWSFQYPHGQVLSICFDFFRNLVWQAARQTQVRVQINVMVQGQGKSPKAVLAEHLKVGALPGRSRVESLTAGAFRQIFLSHLRFLAKLPAPFSSAEIQDAASQWGSPQFHHSLQVKANIGNTKALVLGRSP